MDTDIVVDIMDTMVMVTMGAIMDIMDMDIGEGVAAMDATDTMDVVNPKKKRENVSMLIFFS